MQEDAEAGHLVGPWALVLRGPELQGWSPARKGRGKGQWHGLGDIGGGTVGLYGKLKTGSEGQGTLQRRSLQTVGAFEFVD